ncbi:MAG: EamA family transporter [Syntrophobacteraceae bacterium]|nr:EamA family transporter [Syntrophobacteraceae bacterium]
MKKALPVTPPVTWPAVAAALLAVYIFWGGTYLAMKFAVQTVPPFLMAGTRFCLAGAMVYARDALRGAPAPKPVQLKNASIVGGIMLLGGNGSLVWAEQFVPSGSAAVIYAMVPVWVALLAWLWQGEKRPGWLVFVGLALGLLGISLLIERNGAGLLRASGLWTGYAVLVLGSVFWAVGALYSRVAELPPSPLTSIGLQMLAGGLLCLLVGLMAGEWKELDFASVSTRSVLSMGYLVLFGSIIAYSAYIWLFKVADPILVTTNNYVNPVVAVFAGTMLGGERISSQIVMASSVIIFSVIIVSMANRKKPAVVLKRSVSGAVCPSCGTDGPTRRP